MRTCVTGGPHSGKTTRARELAGESPIHHADELVRELEWSARSEHVAAMLSAPGPWVLEGVVVVRALRKWLAAHADGKPCDRAILLTAAHQPLTDGQARLRKSVHTVWAEILPELVRRGVEVEPRELPSEVAGAPAQAPAPPDEPGPSPLAAYLAAPDPAAAAALLQAAQSGRLTTNDVQAALAQEVIAMTELLAASVDYDAKKVNELRMARVQVQRVLKLLAGVVKRSGSAGEGDAEVYVVMPSELAEDLGDPVPTDYGHLPAGTRERDRATDAFGDEDDEDDA